MATPEGKIKNEILHYLSTVPDGFFWPNASVGIYDVKRKVFRKPVSRFHVNGVSDILGLWRLRPVAIEVKAGYNKPSPDQKKFLARFEDQGGIAIVAWSVEDVAKVIF